VAKKRSQKKEKSNQDLCASCIPLFLLVYSTNGGICFLLIRDGKEIYIYVWCAGRDSRNEKIRSDSFGPFPYEMNRRMAWNSFFFFFTCRAGSVWSRQDGLSTNQ
jgi:hypothetical protein